MTQQALALFFLAVLTATVFFFCLAAGRVTFRGFGISIHFERENDPSGYWVLQGLTATTAISAAVLGGLTLAGVVPLFNGG